MAKHWTAIENQQFIDIMKQYRESIKDQKEAKSIKKITDSFVNDLLLNSVLANRSKQAIYEHITYFDDLLDGISKKENYSKKDGIYFNTERREYKAHHNPLRVWRNASYKS